MKTATPHGSPAWSRTASIADYDGATDKEDSATEGTMPYAAAFCLELRDNLRGDGYSREDDTLIHCENVATARMLQGIVRAGNKIPNNAIPGTADDRLEEWIDVLDIVIRRDDTRQDKRQRCAAQYRAAVGPTRQEFDDAAAELLGGLFVRVHRITGASLSVPPSLTYWPTENPGPSDYSLGKGAWLSERCHLVIEVTYPGGMSMRDYRDLVDAQLFRLGQRMLPVYVTFDWACNVDDGFALDVDQLDFGAVND